MRLKAHTSFSLCWMELSLEAGEDPTSCFLLLSASPCCLLNITLRCAVKKKKRPPAVSPMHPLLQRWRDFTAGIIQFSSNLIQMDWPSESARKGRSFYWFLPLNAPQLCEETERGVLTNSFLSYERIVLNNVGQSEFNYNDGEWIPFHHVFSDSPRWAGTALRKQLFAGRERAL